MDITSSRRRFLQGGTLAVSAAALAACSQKSSDQQAKDADASNSAAASSQAKLKSTAWTKLDYDKVKDGGQVTWARGQLPDNWNYFQADGALADTNVMLTPTGLGAFLVIDEKGGHSFNPDYVKSAEVKSENPMVVSFTWNEKAVWEDGTPIVVDDLIAFAKANSGKDTAYQASSTKGFEQVKEVRKIDDHSGEIEFETPYGDWVNCVFPDLPASICNDPNAFNTGYVTTPIPSHGPFRVANIDQTGKVVTLERNPKWWGRTPKLEKIVFKAVSQDQQPAAFANGELDILEIATGDVLSQAKSRKDAVIQKSNGLTWTHLTINTQGAGGALGDEKVREAIAKGVDRNAVSRAVVQPLEAPIVLNNNLIFMPGQEGYEDSFEGLKFDKDAAAKVLEDAGWKLNGKVREKDGKKLSMKIVVPAGTKSNSDRANQVLTNLNAIGFDISLQSVPADAYFKEYVNTKNFDMVTFSWVGTAFPQSSGVNIFYPAASEQNYTNLNMDDALKDDATTMLQSTDEKKRIEASNSFSKKVADQHVILPFYATPIIFGVKKDLVNVGASQFESADWTAVGFKA